jgi:hypothetical protein
VHVLLAEAVSNYIKAHEGQVSILQDDDIAKSLTLMTKPQIELADMYPHVLLMDFTHCTNPDNCPLFGIMATDALGHGRPILFGINQQSTRQTLVHCLHALKQNMKNWMQNMV